MFFCIQHLLQDLIAEDPSRSMFIPVILSSDKTIVSIATGHNQYWPVYMSISNIHNNVQRTHRNGLVLLRFLTILTSESYILIIFISLINKDCWLANKKTRDNAHFCKFRCQLLHSSLTKILESLKPGMTIPEVVHCPDGHFR
jgi:hypothetical protein